MTPIVLTEAEKEAIRRTAAISREIASGMQTYTLAQLVRDDATTLETLLARAGAEQEKEDAK